MSNLMLITPTGDNDPTGAQQQRIIGIAEVSSVDNIWTLGDFPGSPVLPNGKVTPIWGVSGSTITFVNGSKLAVAETLAQIMAMG